MKTQKIVQDERVLSEQNKIYRDVFWSLIFANWFLTVIDTAFDLQISPWLVTIAPMVLLFGMAARGVLFAGSKRFPKICRKGAAIYAGIMAAQMWVTAYRIYAEQQWEAAKSISGSCIMAVLAFCAYFAGSMLVLYAAYRISTARQRKQETMLKERDE